jgi:hypothetical protein
MECNWTIIVTIVLITLLVHRHNPAALEHVWESVSGQAQEKTIGRGNDYFNGDFLKELYA